MKRPTSVTWLAVGVLTFTGMQILRLAVALGRWEFLKSLSLSVPLNYFVFSGIVWSAAGLVTWWGLWRGKPWARPATIYVAAAFTVYYWIDRLLLASDPLRQTNNLFSIGAMLVALALVYWTVTRPGARNFFGETNE